MISNYEFRRKTPITWPGEYFVGFVAAARSRPPPDIVGEKYVRSVFRAPNNYPAKPAAAVNVRARTRRYGVFDVNSIDSPFPLATDSALTNVPRNRVRHVGRAILRLGGAEKKRTEKISRRAFSLRV